MSNAAPKSDQNRNATNYNHSGNGPIMKHQRGGIGSSGGGIGNSGGGGGGGGGGGSCSNSSNSSALESNHIGSGRPDNMSYPQQRGSYMHSPPIPHNNGWHSQSRGNLDMPNLQALGINPQGQNPPSQQSQNMSNPLATGLNLNSLPMNPAIVAAALNQWSLIGNLQNQNQDQVIKFF